jgi:PAS domain S-box-containing protein
VTLKSIGDAVIATDVNGKINFVNPTAERILGWSQSEAITQRMDEVFRVINENTREPVEGPFSAIKRKGSIVGLANHTLLLTRDGREVPIEDSGAPITDSSGNIIGVIVVFHDVSERRRAEQERERLLESERSARHQAEISDRLKDEFLATVSHELRTPLNAILGWSAMINLGTLDPDMIKNALGIIERNAKAQAEIISDILDVSRIINGKLCVVSHPLEMGPIVRSAVDTLTVAAAAKKITLAVSLDADERFVAGDPDRLQQVVWNLVSNAIKFTPQNGRIDITLSSVNSHLELKVADNGIGIDPKILPFVFERFRQADSSMTRHHGGLGLGLAIVRHLVELHGGTVSAESSGAGQGAAFTVRLPVARCQDSYPDLATIGTGTNDQDLEAVSSIANSGGLDG